MGYWVKLPYSDRARNILTDYRAKAITGSRKQSKAEYNRRKGSRVLNVEELNMRTRQAESGS
jgi:hypothetical protein